MARAGLATALIAVAAPAPTVAWASVPDGAADAGAPRRSSSPATSIPVATSPATPGPAVPPTPTVDRRAARTWLGTAQRLMQQASYLSARGRSDEARVQLDQAVTAFLRSLAAEDNPNVRFELALASARLGKLDEAVKQLRLVVAAPGGTRPDVARKAPVKLAELRAKVGVVTLRVAPAGASVTLGGVELGTAPLREPLVLMPGTYTLSFLAEGFQPTEAEIIVEPGGELTQAIELDAIRVVVEPVQPLPVAVVPAQPARRRSKLPLVIGASLTGLGAVGATVFGVLALGEHATFTDETTSGAARDDARDRGKRFALTADVATGAAVVAAVFTATWYVVKYRQHPEKREARPAPSVAAKLDVVPWVQPQSGGVTIAGWF